VLIEAAKLAPKQDHDLALVYERVRSRAGGPKVLHCGKDVFRAATSVTYILPRQRVHNFS